MERKRANKMSRVTSCLALLAIVLSFALTSSLALVQDDADDVYPVDEKRIKSLSNVKQPSGQDSRAFSAAYDEKELQLENSNDQAGRANNHSKQQKEAQRSTDYNHHIHRSRRDEQRKFHIREKRRPKVSNRMPEFSAPIGNITAVVGRDVRLVCTVEHLGQYQVAWLKEETRTILSIDTNIIITNYRIFLIPDEEERKWVLHIKDVQESDRGFYQCQVNTNPMRSTSGYLEVVVPPTIIESQSSQLAETSEHSNVSIQCKASGHPRATISWKREDGLPIRLNGRSLPTIRTTTMNENSNKAEVVAVDTSTLQPNYPSNEQSQTILVPQSSANQFVAPQITSLAPKASFKDKYYTVDIGDRLEIDCEIEGFPKPDSYFSRKPAHRVAGGVSRRWPRVTDRRAILTHQMLSRQTGSTNSTHLASSGPNNPADLDHLSHATENTNPDLSTKEDQTLEVHSMAGPSNRLYARRQVDEDSSDDDSRSTSQQQISPTITKSSESSTRSRAYMTVGQTVINSYTYQLRLSIAKVQLEDYGEYLCIASNSMGSTEASIMVKRVDRVPELIRSTPDSSSKSNYEDRDYQRDSLEQSVNNRPYTQHSPNNHYPRRVTTGNRVVYDENYLQAIKERQSNSAISDKLQHKLKMAQRNVGQNLVCNQLVMVLFIVISLAINNLLT